MKSLEKSAKTVDEAVQAALTELGISKEKAEVLVLEEPSNGFFGLIGTRQAKVRVTVRSVDAIAVAKQFLQDIFEQMNLSVTMKVEQQSDGMMIQLTGADLGVLIGRHGQTLNSLQYLVNLAANRDTEERRRFILDVEDYRSRRTETLTALAKRLADKVKRRGERVSLEPMSPQERKIIHMALQDEPRIMTYSEGEEPHRKVVISLKK